MTRVSAPRFSGMCRCSTVTVMSFCRRGAGRTVFPSGGRSTTVWRDGWSKAASMHCGSTVGPTGVIFRPFYSARRRGIKVLMRGESGLHLRIHGRMKQMLRRGLMRYLTANVDGFLTIGEHNRQYYLHHGARPERLFAVPYCVDNAFFQERPRRRARRAKGSGRHSGSIRRVP